MGEFQTGRPAFARPFDLPTDPVPAELAAASCLVVCGSGGGSGTAVKYMPESREVLILTNRHVVSQGEPPASWPQNMPWIRVTFPDGRGGKGRFIAHGLDRADLCAIAVPADETWPVVPVAAEPPRQGEAVWLAGYPGSFGRKQTGRAGTFSGHRGRDATYTIYSSGGDSGSGIFSQSKRELVSVLWGGSGPYQCVAVPLTDVQRLVAHCDRPSGSPARPPTGGAGGVGIGVGGPKGGFVGIGVGVVRPVTPPRPPAESPVNPPPNHPPPLMPPANDGKIDALNAKLDKLIEVVANIKPIPGPPGPTGPPGPVGPPGVPGAAFDEGRFLTLEAKITALEARIGAIPGPIKVTVEPKPK